jgi:antagonist of KipI
MPFVGGILIMITVIKQGNLATIQDEGRRGYQAWGMPVSGAMDQYACHMANLLAGNKVNAAVIEMTAEGIILKFDKSQLVSVCGADMQGMVNENPVANWSSFIVPDGGTLSFSRALSGQRAYVAVHGGFDVPKVLGSRSTYTVAGIGGYEGRILHQGDILYLADDTEKKVCTTKIPSAYIPQYTMECTLRIMMGPQYSLFSNEAIHQFLTGTYVVESSNRVAYQLAGPKIMSIVKTNMVSEAVSPGAIQIPSGGAPCIVATADHGTTRGFAKIGYVIQADLMNLVQAKDGNKIHFMAVTQQEAVTSLKQIQQDYEAVKNYIERSFSSTFKKSE